MAIIIKYGKAFKYPLQPGNNSEIETVSGNDILNQSIGNILGTPIGSSFYKEDQGSLLDSLIFESNDEILKSLLDTYIVEAVSQFETRISIDEIQYENSEDSIKCYIYYIVKATGTRELFIYLFEKSE